MNYKNMYFQSIKLLLDGVFNIFCVEVLLCTVHGKPGEAYTRLKTASCEAGPGTTHMCTLEICIWSLHIPNNADRCAFNNSIFDFSKS
jgi:hypothetical protein